MHARDEMRNEPERFRRAFQERRNPHAVAVFEEWLALDSQWRESLRELEELRRQRNQRSQDIGRAKARGEAVDGLVAEVGQIKEKLARLEPEVEALEKRLEELELLLPNVPQGSVPRGADAASNRLERVVGVPREFDFPPKPHWELGVALGLVDFERAAKLSGSRFAVLWGWGARLERALAQFMLDLHTHEHGYLEVLPPYLVQAKTLVGTGQLPKFEEDLFRVAGHDLYLIPTAEVPVTNLHRGEVLDEATLPRRYVSWTPCFRSEAGSYGQDVRGLIRQHQFHKVELVHFATPETSDLELEFMVKAAGRVLEKLELPYRVVTLCTGDMGFSAAKTYDLEVWLPGQGRYREISSCSNCEAFQARRAGIQCRGRGGKTRLVHTLNGSGLAVGRTWIALLENHQQEDGSVLIPEALRPYLGGLERLLPGSP
jgi:seryl-tRNA synthetase